MKMTKKNEFILLVSLLLITRIGDGISTYLVSPDLVGELNPIESVLGFGWIGLFLANLTIIIGIVYSNYYQIFEYNQVIPVDYELKSRKEFISYLYFNRYDKYSWIFYKLPNNWKPVINQFGYVLPRGLIFFGVILVLNNLMIAYRFELYLQLLGLWKYSYIFIYLIGFITVILLFISRVSTEFKFYLQSK